MEKSNGAVRLSKLKWLLISVVLKECILFQSIDKICLKKYQIKTVSDHVV